MMSGGDVYIVQNERGEYANGRREWTRCQDFAFRFRGGVSCYDTGREWAEKHAKGFAAEGIKARAVRLVQSVCRHCGAVVDRMEGAK